MADRITYTGWQAKSRERTKRSRSGCRPYMLHSNIVLHDLMVRIEDALC